LPDRSTPSRTIRAPLEAGAALGEAAFDVLAVAAMVVCGKKPSGDENDPLSIGERSEATEAKRRFTVENVVENIDA